MSTPAPGGATPKSGLHPGIVVGAIAVVVFGAAGAASYLGLLPGQEQKAPSSPVSMASPAQQAGTVPDAMVPPKPVAPAPAPEPVAAAPAPAPQPAAPAYSAPAPAPAPAPTYSAPAPQAAPAPAQPPPQPAARVAPPAPAPAAPAGGYPAPSNPSYASNAPAYAPSAPPPDMAAPVQAPPPAPAPKICRDCGTITSITPIEQKGQGSGAGAVVGGVLGGVLGHQVGSGRGKDVATVAGALGGAFVGNEVEKNRNAVTSWDVRVKLEDGSSKVVRLNSEPSWRVGDKVRIDNGKLVRG